MPTLVLVRDKRVVARLDGRASAPRIEAMLEPHLRSCAAAGTPMTAHRLSPTLDPRYDRCSSVNRGRRRRYMRRLALPSQRLVAVASVARRRGDRDRGRRHAQHQRTRRSERVPGGARDHLDDRRRNLQAKIDNDGKSFDYDAHVRGARGNRCAGAHPLRQPAVCERRSSFFLCANLGNGPAGTQACPRATAATISGDGDGCRRRSGRLPQGIEAGEFDELIAAMRAGVAVRERPLDQVARAARSAASSTASGDAARQSSSRESPA